jgi:hypothetical protein
VDDPAGVEVGQGAADLHRQLDHLG